MSRVSNDLVEKIKQNLNDFVEKNYERYIKILGELVSIPTVAAYAREEMKRCSEFLSDLLKERGFKVYVEEAGGHPAVLAEIGSGSRVVMIYNHYDVQPPDPLDLWKTDPFKAVVKDQFVFGRGVADNKGNIAARLGAIDYILPYLDDLGLKIKFFIEGEEEIGSPTLAKIIEKRRDWVRADGGFWETGYVRRDGRLGISLGFKGMLYVEIVLRGALRDVHSGNAPLVPNPVWRMAKLLTHLKNERGDILFPDIYEGIDPVFVKEAEEMIRGLDFDELEELKKELGLKEFVKGLAGVDALRELYTKPSLNVSGLYAGYTGKGSKTIVPSLAGVKIDIRPVPGQDPTKILERLKDYLSKLGFSDAEIVVHGMYPSGYTRASEKIVRDSIKAAEEVYSRPPAVYPLSGGSGPIYLFTNVAKIPMTGAGVGYYGSAAHAPNENIRIGDFKNSIKHVALTLIYFSK